MLAGDGIFRVGKVKNHGAIFYYLGIACRGKELFEGTNQALRSHEAIIRKLCSCVCDG